MKAVILSGGPGARASKEPGKKPTSAIEIAHMPILLHVMNGYSAHRVDQLDTCFSDERFVNAVAPWKTWA